MHLKARLLGCALAAGALMATACADGAGIEMALGARAWAGCVDQPGFAPYAVVIDTARPGGVFRVSYPGLCAGVHHPPLSGGDADRDEIITDDPEGRCMPRVQVDYRADGMVLVLDYQLGGNAVATARLRAVEADAAPPDCRPNPAIS